MKDGRLLLSVEALEMVRLYSVRGKHANFSGRVLSHQIVSKSIVDLMSLLLSPVNSLPHISIALFL